MIELIVATKNKGKLKEIRALLGGLPLKITSLADYPQAPRIVEDGKSFRGNALKKAATISMWTGKLALGEDSGLEVNALSRRPGVYSARFAGENATDKKNNAKLIRVLKGVPLSKRQARYRCYAALTDGEGIIDVVSGSCSGSIALKAQGENGFGYDPLFYLKRYDQTFGQLPPEVKGRLSHRFRAMKKVRRVLEAYLARRTGSRRRK